MIAVLAFSTQCRACCQLDDKFLNQRQSLMHGDLRGLENCLMAARVWSASSAGIGFVFFLATCIRGYCGPALQQTYSWPCGQWHGRETQNDLSLGLDFTLTITSVFDSRGAAGVRGQRIKEGSPETLNR